MKLISSPWSGGKIAQAVKQVYEKYRGKYFNSVGTFVYNWILAIHFTSYHSDKDNWAKEPSRRCEEMIKGLLPGLGLGLLFTHETVYCDSCEVEHIYMYLGQSGEKYRIPLCGYIGFGERRFIEAKKFLKNNQLNPLGTTEGDPG